MEQEQNPTSNTKPRTKEEDLKDSMELFDVEPPKDINKEFEYEVNIPKETTDKIMLISRIIRVATLTISGYEEQPSSDTTKSIFKLVKHPLASSEVIKHFESILKPYSDESNMVTKKIWDSFRIQAEADWGAFCKFCLREKASPEACERTVYRVFQGCIINIGEITCDNPENMKNLFGGINKEKEIEEGRNIFK